ncbi:MAG: signal peptidase I [Planctomycetota bacterium]|nr:signal peptidase I [Planctomycetota bacterium]
MQHAADGPDGPQQLNEKEEASRTMAAACLTLSILALLAAVVFLGYETYKHVIQARKSFLAFVPIINLAFLVAIVAHAVGALRKRLWSYDFGLYLNFIAALYWGIQLWWKFGAGRLRIPLFAHVAAFILLLASRAVFPALTAGAKDAEGRADQEIGLGRWSLENIEAILLAFIAALVIRCFCIEVFKIPTGSMVPTLLGDLEYGDRIMVNKFAFNVEDPQRFDVIVFKYPLDTTRNFIKRLVGMPDEEIMLSGGDIFYRPRGEERFRIAQKPFRVQQSIWIPHAVIEDGQVEEDAFFSEWAETSDETKREFTRWRRLLITDGGAFQLRNCVRDIYEVRTQYMTLPRSAGTNEVRDVKLRLAFAMRDPGAVLTASISNGAVDFHVTIDPKRSTLVVAPLEARSGPQSQALSADLTIDVGDPGDEHVLELMYYDGLAYVAFDGAQVGKCMLVEYYDSRLDTVRAGRTAASFSVKGGACEVASVAVYRDIFYIAKGCFNEDEPVKVPAGKYVVIGDNSPTSKDSRLWERKEIRTSDGRGYAFDRDNGSDNRGKGELLITRDVFGVERVIPTDSIVDSSVEYLRFIDEKDLVGRGFLVWWPPERMKLVR